MSLEGVEKVKGKRVVKVYVAHHLVDQRWSHMQLLVSLNWGIRVLADGVYSRGCACGDGAKRKQKQALDGWMD
jgi:hypothetical protein